MIIVVNNGSDKQKLQNVIEYLQAQGLTLHISEGAERTVIGLVGATQEQKQNLNAESLDGVEKVMPVVTPYKLASREFHPEDTIIRIGDLTIGGNELQVMAGPCAVESREQMLEVAEMVKASGAKILRGGAFKPRTSPYSFAGLEEKGLQFMAEAREKTGLKIVSEVMDPRSVEMVAEYCDIVQIGARNMQNFNLLREVGKIRKPVLLKRGLSATIEEWIMAAEYVLAGGNEQVIFCERGIRTFETYTRNTLDISAVPIIKSLTHLPIIVDPSHGTGKWRLVEPMAKAAIAAGADGLMIEVHPDPLHAMSDGPQSLKPHKFDAVMKEMQQIAQAMGKTL
ncbi:MAG: 3-deoxy-7-phosphoheptulonate synthase [Peptococcaceae bacterium]|nr:3-deoxy-7-phosphoheptulonate synthase [Peptococcaceae bacterium]